MKGRCERPLAQVRMASGIRSSGAQSPVSTLSLPLAQTIRQPVAGVKLT